MPPFRQMAAPAVITLTCTVLLTWHVLQDLIISVRNACGGQGRDTLLNTTLKVFGKDGMLVKDRELETAQDLRDALKTHFGIIPD